MPRILSWNVAYRYERLPEQLAAVLERSPDLVALQEVTAQTAPRWRDGLEAAGYAVLTTFELAADPAILTGPRKYGQLLASRWPISPLPQADLSAPWPERVLSAIVMSPSGPLELHSAHLPTGVDHCAEKIGTFKTIAAYFEREATCPRILPARRRPRRSGLTTSSPLPDAEGTSRRNGD